MGSVGEARRWDSLDRVEIEAEVGLRGERQ